jgi:transcriptional regulator with XRE-family HTH domain
MTVLDKKTLGAIIKKERQKHGYTKEKLLELIGETYISSTTYDRIESGSSHVSAEKLLIVLHSLGLDDDMNEFLRLTALSDPAVKKAFSSIDKAQKCFLVMWKSDLRRELNESFYDNKHLYHLIYACSPGEAGRIFLEREYKVIYSNLGTKNNLIKHVLYMALFSPGHKIPDISYTREQKSLFKALRRRYSEAVKLYPSSHHRKLEETVIKDYLTPDTLNLFSDTEIHNLYLSTQVKNICILNIDTRRSSNG